MDDDLNAVGAHCPRCGTEYRPGFDECADVVVFFGRDAELPQRLARALPKNKAIELMTEGKLLSFEQGQELGLINYIYESEDYWDKVMEYARGFCPPNKASKTVGRIKRKRLVLAARNWLARHGGEERACRFDVVAVENGAITHLPDAFDAY